MAGPRPAFHAFCLITALALVSSLLGTVAAVPAAAPAAPASLGTAVEAEGGGEQPEGGGDNPGAAGGSGGGQGDRPVEASRPGGSGRDEPRAQADSGGSSRPLTGSPQQPPAPQRPPAPCVPKAPLAAAAAAGESLPYAAPPPVEAPVGALADLERALSEFLAGRPGAYGIAVVDLATGATAAVGADQVFVAASTFKVPLVMYVLDLAARGEADLEEQLFYAPEDWEGGTGILHSSVPGDCHTVSELLNLALTVSDNIATNMLLRRFGEENVFAYMRGLGGTVTNLETGRRATTPRDMVRYLERAYRQAAAEGGHHYRILMGLLTQTAFGDRIAAGAPPGVPVAHKIGTLPAMVHDVGIVFLPEHPFAIAIFSAGVNEQAAAADLAQITRLVSEFLSGWVWDGVPELPGEGSSQPGAPPGDGGGRPAGEPGAPPGDGGDQPAGEPGAPPGDGGGQPAGEPGAPPGDGGDQPASEPDAPPGDGGDQPAGEPDAPPGDGPAPPEDRQWNRG